MAQRRKTAYTPLHPS